MSVAQFGVTPQTSFLSTLPRMRSEKGPEGLAKRREALSRLSLSLASCTPDELSRNLAALLHPLLDIELLRAQPEMDAQGARLRLLLELTNSVAANQELDDLLKEVTVGVRGGIRSDVALAGLWDSGTGQLHLNAFDVPDGTVFYEEDRDLLGKILGERVFSTGKPC